MPTWDEAAARARIVAADATLAAWRDLPDPSTERYIAGIEREDARRGLCSHAPSDLRAALAALDAERAENARLRAALTRIGEFAQRHHAEQPEHEWLHALLVDIPEMVRDVDPELLPVVAADWPEWPEWPEDASHD